MPSIQHELLVGLFRTRPELAASLLRDVLHVELPSYTEARIEGADLSEVAPAEYRADLVVLLVDGKPVLAIIVEVQLSPDNDKPFRWPLYVAGLRSRFLCPTCLLVVTPSEAVADWARTPIVVGPGMSLTPFVVGPKAVPVVVDAAVARKDPELAVLSVMAHGKTEAGFSIAVALLEALREVNSADAVLYFDLIEISLNQLAKAAFKDLMANGDPRSLRLARNYEFQGDFAREHRAAGRAEGRLEGEARAVIAVLQARGIVVSERQSAAILACTELDTVTQWIRDALTVTSADELVLGRRD